MGGAVDTETATRPPSTEPAAPSELRAHYRPQLDGLRAVAVYLVVAFHAGLGAFSGGFIGVDVFFVLSGYLVTLLLLRDFRAAGRIDFRRFYARRFRRLLPAAFVTLVVTAAVYVAVAAPTDVAGAEGGFRAAFLYVANWHFISQSNDYFAANVNSNPVLHFWSLAVEEQFYLAWPLLLTAATLVARRAGDRQWKVVRLIVAGGFVASLVAALHLSTVDLSRAYYGTDTRAYELLAGALLAMTPGVMRFARARRQLVQALAGLDLAVLVLVATSAIHLGAIQRGVAATIATSGLIVALEVSEAGVVRRILSTPTAAYLGRVSYGTYLWHWPVIVIATLRFHPNPVSLFALTCLVGTGVASLSFQLLEHPIRISRLLDRGRTVVIATGLATSLIGGLVIVPAILRHNRGSAATSAAVLGQAAQGGGWQVAVPRLDWASVASEKFGGATCFRTSVAGCVVVKGGSPRILLVGDSHALGFVPAFTALAHAGGYTLAVATLPNCPWEQGIVEAPPLAPTSLPQSCHAHQRDWYQRVVPQYKPDVVVLVHHPFDASNEFDAISDANGQVVTTKSPSFERDLRSAAKATIGSLAAPGRKIVIFEPLPLAPATFNPLSCLSQAKYLEQCRYVASDHPTRLERYFRSLGDGRNIFAVDLDRLVCPYLPICDPLVNGVVVKKDPQHITAKYSAQLADPIASLLRADGVLPKG